MATVRDSRHYSNDLLQGGLKVISYTSSYMAVPLAEACSLCCDSECNFDTWKFLVYHFSLNTAATPRHYNG